MADQSSIGSHLAELYNGIHQQQQKVEDAKAKVKEEETALDKIKGQFANYLKEAGIDKLLAPAAQADLFSQPKAQAEGKERKPRTSSADKQAVIDRNKAIYTSTYPNGIDDKTGLPKRFKGRGKANEEIDAQMKDDERDYSARNGGDSNDNLELPLPDALTGSTAPSTVADYQEAADKPAGKPKKAATAK